ncbi:MAG: succinate dehydrogenase assembly factor 2 [Pseudomonadota bacterium]
MHNLEAAELKKKQLQWQCRRGMLENDFILKRYLSNSYLQADETEQALFESLLLENDQKLFLWFMGREEAPPKYCALIEKLRR